MKEILDGDMVFSCNICGEHFTRDTEGVGYLTDMGIYFGKFAVDYDRHLCNDCHVKFMR
jgi:hypothetical protein